MKNKRNKLQIKENWKKELNLSSKQLLKLKGGTTGGGPPTCTDNLSVTDTLEDETVPSADCPCR